MKILNQIISYLKGDSSSTEAPHGYCPNCWGREEYGGKFYTAVRKENIDLKNVEKATGWINAYAVKHLEGIKLKTENHVQSCPSCKLTYKPEV